MLRHARTHIRRDAALRRLDRVNRWLIAGSVALTGVFTEVAASAFPGHERSQGVRVQAVRAAPAITPLPRLLELPESGAASRPSPSDHAGIGAHAGSARPGIRRRHRNPRPHRNPRRPRTSSPESTPSTGIGAHARIRAAPQESAPRTESRAGPPRNRRRSSRGAPDPARRRGRRTPAQPTPAPRRSRTFADASWEALGTTCRAAPHRSAARSAPRAPRSSTSSTRSTVRAAAFARTPTSRA